MSVALITGCTGQDGSYLAEFLLSKNYTVHGIIRRASTFNTSRIEHIRERMTLWYGDITDASRLADIVQQVQPDEIYNLAAQSHVRVSFDMPWYTRETIAVGTDNLMQACLKLSGVKVYSAQSSEQMGNRPAPQNEDTPFESCSPYAAAKIEAHQICHQYRHGWAVKVSCGILFNHESPRRTPTFVTRKITRAAARIKLGLQPDLVLGNLDAKRDWGFAGDYVKAMWLMLQQDQPDDFVIATGETHSVREFLDAVFGHPKINLDWHDKVRQDPKYFRPTEVNWLQGDASKSKRVLGWEPTVTFQGLVDMMVEHDLAEAKKEWALVQRGYQTVGA